MLTYFGLTQYCVLGRAAQKKLFFKPLFDFKMYENKILAESDRDFEEIPCETKTPEEPPEHR